MRCAGLRERIIWYGVCGIELGYGATHLAESSLLNSSSSSLSICDRCVSLSLSLLLSRACSLSLFSLFSLSLLPLLPLLPLLLLLSLAPSESRCLSCTCAVVPRISVCVCADRLNTVCTRPAPPPPPPPRSPSTPPSPPPSARPQRLLLLRSLRQRRGGQEREEGSKRGGGREEGRGGV
eukprot:193242-Rhodomonas_salina.1